MKRPILGFLAVVIFFMTVPAGEATAQRFLDRIGKAVDKATNAVDKAFDSVLGTSEDNATPAKSAFVVTNEQGVTISSFSPDVHFNILSCVRDGNEVTIEYAVRNDGPALRINGIGTKRTIINPDHGTDIYDDKGNQYPVKFLTLGNAYSERADKSIDVTLPTGVTMRGSIEVNPVDVSAGSFSLVNIAGITYDNNNEVVPVEFTFKNLPIHNFEDIQAQARVLVKRENPTVAGASEEFVMRAATITDRSTRIDMTYKNSKYNPYAYVWIVPAQNYIEVDGKKYKLLTFSTIGKRKNEVMVDYGKSLNYSLIFEPIPAGTEVFTLYGDEGHTTQVWMVDRQGFYVPKTTGVMSLNDSYGQHDNLKRIIPAERTALKIDRIKHSDFNTSWTNSQLAKGKEIYEGEEGKLLTVIFIEPDHASTEFLLSYDSAGNLVDCVPIASIHAYGGDRGVGTIEGDKVTARFSAEGQSYYVLYNITPQMKFQQLKSWNADDY